jgi:hypothetical protein
LLATLRKQSWINYSTNKQRYNCEKSQQNERSVEMKLTMLKMSKKKIIGAVCAIALFAGGGVVGAQIYANAANNAIAVLPIAKGGTNANTASTAATNILGTNFDNYIGILPLAKGGTGTTLGNGAAGQYLTSNANGTSNWSNLLFSVPTTYKSVNVGNGANFNLATQLGIPAGTFITANFYYNNDGNGAMHVKYGGKADFWKSSSSGTGGVFISGVAGGFVVTHDSSGNTGCSVQVVY